MIDLDQLNQAAAAQQNNQNSNNGTAPQNGINLNQLNAAYMNSVQQGQMRNNPQSQSFLGSIANSAPVQAINNFGGGVAQGLSNAPLGALTLASRATDVGNGNYSMQAPFANQNSLMTKFGSFLGASVPFIATDGALGAASTAGRMAAQGAVGMASDPNNPAVGAALGAAGPAVADAAGGIANWISGMSISRYAKQMMNKLTNGTSIADNASQINSKINDQFTSQKGISQQGFNNGWNTARQYGVFDNMSSPNTQNAMASFFDKSGKPTDLGSQLQSSNTQLYKQLSKFNGNMQYTPPASSIVDQYGNSLGYQAPSNFVSSNTVQDAHNLQSDIGRAVSNLSTPLNSSVEKNLGFQLSKLRGGVQMGSDGKTPVLGADGATPVRTGLQGDIQSQLQGTPALGMYNNSLDNWQQNLLPYHKIFDIANGNQTNSKSLASIFAAPENPDLSPSMMTIANHGDAAGNNLKNNIIAEALKNSVSLDGSVNAGNLSAAANRLASNKLSPYVTPDAEKMIGGLQSMMGMEPANFGALAGHPIISSAMKAFPIINTASKFVSSPAALRAAQGGALSGLLNHTGDQYGV